MARTKKSLSKKGRKLPKSKHQPKILAIEELSEQNLITNRIEAANDENDSHESYDDKTLSIDDYEFKPKMNQVEVPANLPLVECKGKTNGKKKVAPRSSEQFKIGPKFNDTEVHRKIYLSGTNEHVIPVLDVRIDRGFDFIEDEWIGYKRNYFTLVSAFQFLGKDNSLVFNEKFHVVDNSGNELNLRCFALRLVSNCCEENIRVNLIQHTAKRDRGPQYLPPVYPAIPGVLPHHNIIKQSANIRNGSKIDQFNKLFSISSEDAKSKSRKDSIIQTYPEDKVTTVARYERMQFSTSINYRKPALTNRHFVLRVELLGVLDDGRYTILATMESPPLIVRGRSPSNYQIAKANYKSLMKRRANGEEENEKTYELLRNDYESFTDLQKSRMLHNRPNPDLISFNEHQIITAPKKIKKMEQVNEKYFNFGMNRNIEIHEDSNRLPQSSSTDTNLDHEYSYHNTNLFRESTNMATPYVPPSTNYYINNNVPFDPSLEYRGFKSVKKHKHKHRSKKHRHRSHRHDEHRLRRKHRNHKDEGRPVSGVEKDHDSSFNEFKDEMDRLQRKL